MEAEFILNTHRLKQYCEEHSSQLTASDNRCKGCSRYRNCLHLSKEWYIYAVLKMTNAETRFPFLLKAANKHPGILSYVPAKVYQILYGFERGDLTCPYAGRNIAESLDRIEDALGLFSDENSCLTLLNVLMYRLTQNRDYALRAYGMDPQYFIEGFRGLGPEEVFVDCGAYIGDTFVDYCRVNAPPRAAYLFEPDEKNLATMDRVLTTCKEKTDLHIIDKCVSDISGTLSFVSGKHEGSHIAGDGAEGGITHLAATTLDDAISEDVSFIKMDIEGAEKSALIGAKELIHRSYPKLAICVYHTVQDLWEIPLLIRELFPEYTCYQLRHHTMSFGDTVLYVSR